jgi:hypothetical protein
MAKEVIMISETHTQDILKVRIDANTSQMLERARNYEKQIHSAKYP